MYATAALLLVRLRHFHSQLLTPVKIDRQCSLSKRPLRVTSVLLQCHRGQGTPQFQGALPHGGPGDLQWGSITTSTGSRLRLCQNGQRWHAELVTPLKSTLIAEVAALPSHRSCCISADLTLPVYPAKRVCMQEDGNTQAGDTVSCECGVALWP